MTTATVQGIGTNRSPPDAGPTPSRTFTVGSSGSHGPLGSHRIGRALGGTANAPRMIAIGALVVGIVGCQGSAPSSPDSQSVAIAQPSLDGSEPAASQFATPSLATPSVRATAGPSGVPTKRRPNRTTGPRPSFAVGDLVVTVTDNLRVRSKPGVSADSLKYEPVLEAGTDLQILGGPVAASGFWWYRVRLLDGMTLHDGIADGWVAASDHDGTAWIDQETDGYLPGPDTDPVPEPDGAALPTPVLVMVDSGAYVDASGASYIRHNMSISNWSDYPPELFALTPDQVSCPSRTWVGIDDADTGDRIYTFCGFAEPATWSTSGSGRAPGPRRLATCLSNSMI